MKFYSSHPDKGLNVKYNVAIILQISKFTEVKGDVLQIHSYTPTVSYWHIATSVLA